MGSEPFSIRSRASGGRVQSDLVDDVDRLSRWEGEWDSLAVACGRPFSAPAWMLAWWRHAAPRNSSLKVAVVHEGNDLVGIAPLYVTRRPGGISQFRLLAGDACFRAEPLARPGAEAEVAGEVAVMLAGSNPAPDLMTFDGIPASCPWPDLLRDAWPKAGGKARVQNVMPAPTVTMSSHQSFDAWFASRSRNFRQQIRRTRRQLIGREAAFRLADPKDPDAAVDDFAALHRKRWKGRGGSSTLDAGVEHMVRVAARRMMQDLRLRIWTLDVSGRTVSSHVFLAAGGEVSYWLGGFDPAWARYHPGIQVLVSSVEHAWAMGDHRLDLGGGGQDYKYRLADGEESLQWIDLIPTGPRSARVWTLLASRAAYRSVSKYVPQPVSARLKALLGEPSHRA
jgi:CelD/BcsL family acetyltransferase involved in cellulose biosynthesis